MENTFESNMTIATFKQGIQGNSRKIAHGMALVLFGALLAPWSIADQLAPTIGSEPGNVSHRGASLASFPVEVKPRAKPRPKKSHSPKKEGAAEAAPSGSSGEGFV